MSARNEYPGGMGINGVIPGGGVCVVDVCHRRCPEGALMCRDHWSAVPPALRMLLRAWMSRWSANDATLQQLRDAQWACVESLDPAVGGSAAGTGGAR